MSDPIDRMVEDAMKTNEILRGITWKCRACGESPEGDVHDCPVPKNDPVHHPSQSALSPEEYIGYLRGQVLKYQWRLGRKGSAVQDAAKSEWYLNRLILALQEEQDRRVGHLERQLMDEARRGDE